MATYYTVKKGDTLSEIAYANQGKYYPSWSWQTYMDKLQAWNGIKNTNLIYPGQKLIMTNKNSSSNSAVKNTSPKAIVNEFGIQNGTTNTLYAAWRWDKSYTENYEVQWSYATGDGIWFVGNYGTSEHKQATYSIPENATRVRFRVKPISKKHTVNNKEVSYWTATWTTYIYHNTKDNPPDTPPTPTTDIKDLKLTVSVDNLDVNATHVQFQIIKNNTGTSNSSSYIKIKDNFASHVFNLSAGADYKARCRAVKSKMFSDWSDWSSNVGTEPSRPRIASIRAYDSDKIQVRYYMVPNAESYEIQYTEKKDYFDAAQDQVKTTTIDSGTQQSAIITVDTGKEWFFRMRAKNSAGESPWTDIKSCIIGDAPASPTTWSLTTTAIVGENVDLYWTHNSKDASSKRYSKVRLKITEGNITQTTIETLDHTTESDDDRDGPGHYVIDTSSYQEGVKIEWDVCTAGVLKDTSGNPMYGEWSIVRSIDVYAQPTLLMSITNSNAESIETVETFPFYIVGEPGPDTQTPIGYHLDIISNDTYETVDETGNRKIVNQNDSVYSKLFDTNEDLRVQLSASNIDLENGMSYTAKCTVTMNSGLSAEESLDFTVNWEDIDYSPNAEIFVDSESISVSIRPYCEDAEGVLIEDVLLSVYRREFDGTFTELCSDVSNTNVFVTDPHPSLDYARYRIVAKSISTGTISYYDMPGYPIGEHSIVLQWNEEWRELDMTGYSEDIMAEEQEASAWSGSLLKLPYNVDVSDNYDPDVEHVNYIGRSHPVAYYGTHVGSKSSWSSEIPKDDKDTLYVLRRLAIYMGNVYVREPSGSGYWATVNVSFGQTHCELTIPVSLDIVRVEGGI